MRRALGAALLALAALAGRPASAAEALRAVVLDVVVLPAAWKLREVSALAWDAERGELLAASDRGRLWRLKLAIDGGRIAVAEPAAPWRIEAAARRPNAEALAWRGGELLLADEAAADAWRLDAAGGWIGFEPLPEALRDPAARRTANSGVEALAWHPRHGLLAAPQRPLAGQAGDRHVVHAADGSAWSFAAAPGGRSSIKAMELLDAERLLVLEKLAVGSAHRTLLRLVSLQGAGAAAGAELADPRLAADDNFEGLACLDARRCLLASDDAGSGRTVLVLVELR